MKIKRLNDTAIIPTRANPTDAGLDISAPEDVYISDYYTINTGICIQLPKGTAGLIFARSGLATKHGIRPRNCVGVIDEKYRGEIKVTLENPDPHKAYLVKKGDRIAQLVVVPIIILDIEEVEELDMEGDRMGGYGHTGR